MSYKCKVKDKDADTVLITLKLNQSLHSLIKRRLTLELTHTIESNDYRTPGDRCMHAKTSCLRCVVLAAEKIAFSYLVRVVS